MSMTKLQTVCVCGERIVYATSRKQRSYANFSCHCNCGKAWGEHGILAVCKPKDRCVNCGAWIDIKSYYSRGNFCMYCTNRVNKRLGIELSKPRRGEVGISDVS